MSVLAQQSHAPVTHHSDLVLSVVAIDDEAGVRTLTLAAPDGSLLPAYVPGSHLVVECGARSNAYSLLDDGVVAARYRISVLLCPDGAGGSRWIHDLRVGSELAVSLPRSAFPPVAAGRHHLLIAAGIGVTPILSHARAAQRWGRSSTVLYRYRPGRSTHLAELRAICGTRLEQFPDRRSFADRLAALLLVQPLGAQLYVCGPGTFTDHVLASAEAAGWPRERLQSERFSAADLAPGRAFSVRLTDGRTLDVPTGESLLAVLESNGFNVPNRCRQGVCGECRIDVASGRPEHRDYYLSEPERATNDSLMCCVSRAYGELELSL